MSHRGIDVSVSIFACFITIYKWTQNPRTKREEGKAGHGQLAFTCSLGMMYQMAVALLRIEGLVVLLVEPTVLVTRSSASSHPY
jgi:hypothetical protein